MWVRIPPAAPLPPILDIECRATPPDESLCLDPRDVGGAYAYLLGLYLGDGTLCQAPRRVWRLRIVLAAVSHDHRALPVGRRTSCVALCDENEEARLLRGVQQLEALALCLPAARSRAKASSTNRAQRMATPGRGRTSRRTPARACSFRWVSKHESRPPTAERWCSRVRLSALLLLEPLAGPPETVRRDLRIDRCRHPT
jgi:hypothetical protein